MLVSEIKKQLEDKTRELMNSSDIDAKLEKALGRPIKTNTDEESAIAKVMLSAMSELVQGAMAGEKIYYLKSKVASYNILGAVLEFPGINLEKMKQLTQSVPEFINFNASGVFSQDKGFYGKMEYEADFVDKFLRPLFNALASEQESSEQEGQKEMLSAMQNMYENMLQAQYLFQPYEELRAWPNDMESIELSDSEGQLITDTAQGFNTFLESRALGKIGDMEIKQSSNLSAETKTPNKPNM